MADSQIRVRFATTGLKQMRDDLKAAGQEGSEACRKIGDNLKNPNKALGMTVSELELIRTAGQAAGREMETWFRKVDGIVTRLNPNMAALKSRVVLGNQTDLQSKINAATGVTGTTYSASSASAVFLEQEKRAQALREALNPTIVAERTFSASVAEATELLSAGAINEAEHTTAIAAARAEFTKAEKAARGLAGGVGLTRVEMMELEHSVRAVGDSLASGQNPLRALAMEGGRVAQVVGENPGGAATAMKAFGAMIFSPIGALVGLGAAALGAGAFIGKLKENIKEAGGQAEDLERTAAKVGVTVEKLQALRYAAQQLDVEPKSVDSTLTSLNRALGVAQNGGRGSQLVQEGFKMAGIDPATLGQYHDAAEILPKVADGFRNAGDAAQRAAIARYLRLEPDSIPLLLQGGDALNRLQQSARDLGIVLDASVVKSMAESNVKLREANQIIGAETTNALVGLDEKLASSMVKLALFAKHVGDWTAQVRGLITAGEQAGNVQPPSIKPGLAQMPGGWMGRGLAGAGYVLGTAWDSVTGERRSPHRATSAASGTATAPTGPTPEQLQDQATALSKLDDLQARLLTHTTHRRDVEKDIAKIEELQGKALDPKLKAQLLAAGSKEDAAPGQRKDDAAARKAAAEAERAASAEREWTSARAEALKVDHNLTDAENKLTELRNRGARIKPADAQAYLDTAAAKDAGDLLKRQNDAAKSDREWAQALSGVTKESENLDHAQELIAKRTQENKKPTEDEIARLVAFAKAADRAAEASKALDGAKSAVKDASENVMGSLPEPKTAAGRYDPTAATQQWENARGAIYAEAEQRIRAAHAASVATNGETELEAASKTAAEIAGLDAAYALQSAQETLAIRKKAADDGTRYNEEQEAAFNSRIASTAGDFGSAIMRLASGGQAGNVGRDLAKQILEQILQTLVSDPLVALIKQELQQVMSPQVAGGGGPLGLLSTGLRTLFGAPGGGLTMPNGLSFDAAAPLSLTQAGAIGDLSTLVPDVTIALPGHAAGTNSTADGLHWVGEYGPELRWQSGMSIKSAADSSDWIRNMQNQAFGAGAQAGIGSSGGMTLHYSPVTHIDATGADPAQLQRTQDSMHRWQKSEPARVAAYLKVAKLR